MSLFCNYKQRKCTIVVDCHFTLSRCEIVWTHLPAQWNPVWAQWRGCSLEAGQDVRTRSTAEATWSYVRTPYDRTGRVIRQPSTNVLFMSYFILLMFIREKTLQPLLKMSKSWTPLETLELTSVDVGLFGWVCFVVSPPPQRGCRLFIRMIPMDSDSTWGTAPFSPKAPAVWQTFAHRPLSSCPASQASDKPALVRQEAWLNAEKSGLGETSPHAAPLSQRENRGQAAYLASKEQPLGFFTWCSSSSNHMVGYWFPVSNYGTWMVSRIIGIRLEVGGLVCWAILCGGFNFSVSQTDGVMKAPPTLFTGLFHHMLPKDLCWQWTSTRDLPLIMPAFTEDWELSIILFVLCYFSML